MTQPRSPQSPPDIPSDAQPDGAPPRPEDVGPDPRAGLGAGIAELRRSRTDRRVAGVAGGLGRHLDVDPTLVRVVLVVLALFGGAGLVVYAIAWLLVPDEGTDRAPLGLSPAVRLVLLGGALALGAVLVLGVGLGGFGGDSPLGGLVVLVGLGLVGALVVGRLRDRGETPRSPGPAPWASGAEAPPWEPTGTAAYDTDALSETGPVTADGPGGPDGPVWAPPPATPGGPPRRPARPARPARPRRTGVVWFWPTLALVVLALGVLGVVDSGGASVPAAAYPALALGVVAVMLLVGAFVGRAGGLIALGLVAALALGATVLTSAGGGVADLTRVQQLHASPGVAEGIAPSYRIHNGELTLDLSRVDPATLDGRTVRLRADVGQVTVTLPPGVNARVRAEVALAGQIVTDQATRGGVGPQLSTLVPAQDPDGDGPQDSDGDPDAPTMQLEIRARLGGITVIRG